MSTDAAIGLLARMMTGLSITSQAPPDEEGEPMPDFSAESIEAVGETAVGTTLVLPSGDKYRVTIEWLKDVSP